jgi:hypothetical protein
LETAALAADMQKGTRRDDGSGGTLVLWKRRRAHPMELKQPTRSDLHNGGFHDP